MISRLIDSPAGSNTLRMNRENRQLEEDRVGEVTINQNRRDQWWSAMLANSQWQHANQRLLPSAFPEGRGTTIARMFRRYRSMESWWEIAKPSYLPEFVEWVEDQRTKAA